MINKIDDTTLKNVTGGSSDTIEGLKRRIEMLEAEKAKRLQQITALDDQINAERLRQLVSGREQ